MKFGIFVHPTKPKVAVEKIKRKLLRAGLQYSQTRPDAGVVVGGDGTFGFYGRALDVPLLFVGVDEPGFLGSRARLAEVKLHKLEDCLRLIKAGKFSVVEKGMLHVGLRGRYYDVLTDVYLEREGFAGCMRYTVSVFRSGALEFKEYAIGNGIVISTSFGSSGYYSYPDRLIGRIANNIKGFSEGRIGVCHIIPLHLVRERNGKSRLCNTLRYTTPFHSTLIRINLARDTNTHLFGVTAHSEGVRLNRGDTVTITGSTKKARTIELG